MSDLEKPDPFAKPELEEPDIQIDTPINLRPDLALFGIEETDRGVCVDTFENRQALRRAKFNWLPVYALNGVPTGLIQAISPEMQAQQRLLSLDEKVAILSDPTDKNSDYITGYDLLAESAADYIAPPWVLGATRSWAKQQSSGELAHGKKELPRPSRCKAIKDDGIRCQLWTGGRPQDDGFCRVHLSSLRNKPTDSVERARQRLTQATPTAVDVLEQLMDNAESEPVKLKAATEILDRAGIRAGIDINTDITLDVRPAASVIAERLQRIAQNAIEAQQRMSEAEAQQQSIIVEEVVDAEVVEENAKKPETE
jgi:flagellar hook-basal body complex protein FliE